MGTSIGLNLACGEKLYKSDETIHWINVDLPGTCAIAKPDLEADIRKLPLDDEYADYIEAIHVLEHFHVYEADAVLREWHRVLKTGGVITIEVPCMNKILECFKKGMDFQYTWLGLYGDARDGRPEMDHHWCYSISQLRALLKQVGFKDIELSEPLYHLKERDMRFNARK